MTSLLEVGNELLSLLDAVLQLRQRLLYELSLEVVHLAETEVLLNSVLAEKNWRGEVFGLCDVGSAQ